MKLQQNILRFIQHIEAVEVRCTYDDLPLAFAQIIVPVPRDADGAYVGGKALSDAIAHMAPTRQWFEEQNDRLAGTAPQLQQLPRELLAAVPVVGDVTPDWFEDVALGEPELIDGQWGRRRITVDLRQSAANLPTLKARLKALLSDVRWRHETGGITINGVAIQTDRESQANITAAYARAQAAPGTAVRWKAANGFVHLDAQAIGTVSDAVFNHVQAAFAHEAALSAKIDAAHDVAALLAVDIGAGWV